MVLNERIRWNEAALGRTVRIVASDMRFSMLVAVYKRWLTVGHFTGLPESCQSPVPCIAALEPHNRHKLRCNSEGLLSYSWVEIECQLDSSRSTRNGHRAEIEKIRFTAAKLTDKIPIQIEVPTAAGRGDPQPTKSRSRRTHSEADVCRPSHSKLVTG